MREKICGIYGIINIKNNMKYVGKSIDIINRFWTHRTCLRGINSKYENEYLQNAWDKYGENNFEFYIIEKCDRDSLSEREMYYIKLLNTKYPNGYNFTDGGEGVLGYTHNAERRKKIGENTPKRTGEKHHMFGFHWPEEMKKYLSECNSGKNSPVFATKHPNSASRYYGVSIYRQTQHPKNKESYIKVYWKAQLRIGGKQVVVSGYFKTDVDAAMAYDKYIIEHDLSNPLNFPERLMDGIYYDA
jgi:group I intron endonuclease